MKFKFDEFFWVAAVQLPAWSEYTQGRATRMVFDPEEPDEAPMTDDDLALTRWVADNTEKQKPVVSKAIFDAYPTYRREYFEDYGLEENEEELPTISSPEELVHLIELGTVHVHPFSRDGIPYVGYEFECKWDSEHGLGVLMHGNRVVDIGHADTAFERWIAKRDMTG